MKKWFHILVIFLLLLMLAPPQQTTAAQGEREPLKAAFIRQGNLWVKVGTFEKKITDGEQIGSPEWSRDGQWLAYSVSRTEGQQERSHVWVYHLPTGQRFLASMPGDLYDHSYKWAPDKNALAFQSNGQVRMRSYEAGRQSEIRDIVPGVDSFAWLPDGSGFLASSPAVPMPDGWSNPILFKVALQGENGEQGGKAERFFTLPNSLKKGDSEILAIGTSTFKWSPDGKWIAFIVSPTASWSMDSNMLCVLSADGKTFTVLDEMLINEDWFRWAPGANLLGYIAGGGRIVLSTDKDLTVKELPALLPSKLTPENFADHDFTWETDSVLVTSRMREAPWSNDPAKRPLPRLVRIDLKQNRQTPVSSPPAKFGDFSPVYLRHIDRLAWIRKSLQEADVMLGNADGSEAKPWIKNADLVSWYEK